MDISIKWNVCRVCLLEDPQKSEEKEDAMKYIFNDNKLSQQIFDCSGVVVRANDSLPQKICRKCLTALKLAVNFRRTCQSSDKYLQMVMQKAKSATSLFKLKKPRENSLDTMEEDIVGEALDENVDSTHDDFSDYSGSFSGKLPSESTNNSPGHKTNMEKSVAERNTEVVLAEEPESDKRSEENGNIITPGHKLSQDQTSNLVNDYLLGLSNQKNECIDDDAEVKTIRLRTTEAVKQELSAEAAPEFSLEVDAVENDDEIELRCQYLEGNKQEQSDNSLSSIASAAIEGYDDNNPHEREPNEVLHHISNETDSKSDERQFFYIISNEIKAEEKYDYEHAEDIEVEQTSYISMDDDVLKSGNHEVDDTVEYLLESPDEQSQSAPDNKNYISHSDTVVMRAIKDYPKRKRNIGKGTIFICDICGNHFTNRNLLNFHMKIHRNEKNFECELCFKRFNAACNLSAHMRIHTGEKPYGCQYCNRRFADRSTHIKHERIHTNEKPYTCSTCGKAFSLSTSLKAHEKIHTGEKPFRCNPCSKSFKLPHQLKAHLNTHLHKLLSLEQ